MIFSGRTTPQETGLLPATVDARVRAALDWLLRSEAATGHQGSAAHYWPVLG